MQNYRVEYYDPKTNSMKVVFMDAEDLVAVKEKPNPNCLSQKGNLLTQTLKREC